MSYFMDHIVFWYLMVRLIYIRIIIFQISKVKCIYYKNLYNNIYVLLNFIHVFYTLK